MGGALRRADFDHIRPAREGEAVAVAGEGRGLNRQGVIFAFRENKGVGLAESYLDKVLRLSVDDKVRRVIVLSR